MSPNAGGRGGVAGCQPVSTQLYTGAQINFGDVTLYLTSGGVDPPLQNKPTDPYPDLIKSFSTKEFLFLVYRFKKCTFCSEKKSAFSAKYHTFRLVKVKI